MPLPLSPFRKAAAETVARALGVDADSLPVTLPPRPGMGDFAVGVFPAARIKQAPPPKLAAEVVDGFSPGELLAGAKAAGPYVNFTVRPEALWRQVAQDIAAGAPLCARPSAGDTVCIDYSSPNVAKHLAYHHIRSTVIGQALANMHRALGARVVAINHLGDWGTTHGMLLCAYDRWGAPDPLTIGALNELYVRFRAEMATDPTLEEEGRAWFKRLEDGDEKARAIWQRFRDVSLREFQEIYDLLGVSFDEIRGESAYEDAMQGVIDRLEEKGLTSRSDGALVVDLSSEGDLPPLLLRKQDGATLYATRDLAAAEYRWNQYHPNRSLYVVGHGQALHFKQLFLTLAKAGHEWADRLEHVGFGLVRLGGKKTATRTGNVVLLTEVLAEAQARTLALMQDTSSELTPKERATVARQVGIGAVVFANLSQQREKDVDFAWEDVIDLKGDAGPYVQYSHARIASILRRAGTPSPASPEDMLRLQRDEEWTLGRMLTDYTDELGRAAQHNEPHILVRYLLDLCAQFSRWYTLGNQDAGLKVITDDEATTRARLTLATATRQVLAHGLGLLGLEAPDRM